MLGAALAATAALTSAQVAGAASPGLWRTYDDVLVNARHITLNHVIAPRIPVWRGFAPVDLRARGQPAHGPAVHVRQHGFEANAYQLGTDQLGTQLDPPAHWDPNRPAIDELPATYAGVRPLAVISIVRQVRHRADYHLQVRDIRRWERRHGRIPEGSVVMVRSDWSKRWPDPALAQNREFPGVGLQALNFLHRKRHILAHGHEPLDTDTTPTLEGEAWLLHNGYAQAEGVANLHRVPATGCLVSIGFPRFKGGLGGFASYTALCPRRWRHGTRISRRDAPLERIDAPLHWDPNAGTRVR